MADKPLAHPEKEELVAFGLGKLTPDEVTKIESHLDQCAACCETLLDLKDDTFVELVRTSPAPCKSKNQTVKDAEPAGKEATVGEATDEAISAATMLVDSKMASDPDHAQHPPGHSGNRGLPPFSPDLPAQLHDHARYRIIELIGKGGMGDVFKAEHRLMDRVVAIKLINQGLVQNTQAVERFRREVRAAARLAHPNIVTAYDAEQAGDSHFLVMEYVDGTDLASVVKQRGPLPIAEACGCIRQVAGGLQHAHEMGMVHRDIKPHNLMLPNSQKSRDKSPGQEGGSDSSGSGFSSLDSQPSVKILDFGLASFAAESAMLEVDSDENDSELVPLHLTTMGSVMGTPDYIAPEQARDAHSADIRADIYSLGCTLYYLLSGQLPHKADTVVEKLKAHAEQEPEAIDSVRVDVPEELADVLRRMMAKDPAERFQTPAEVADALAPFVDQHRTDGGGLGATDRSAGQAAPQNPLPITFALCFAGTLSVLAFVLAVVLFLAAEWTIGIPPAFLSWLKFGGLASLPAGATALFLANRSEKKNSHASAVAAGLINLLPVNPFVVVLLPLTIWTLLRLRNPSARVMYETCPAVDREEVKRRWPLVITTVACLLIAIYAGTFFVIQLGRTTLKFEINDPTLTVRFKDEVISIDNDGNTIDIKPGRQHEFVVEQHGVEVETDALTLRKGDKVVLRVSVIEDEVLVDADGVRVSRKAPVNSTTSTESDQQLIQGKWRLVALTDNGEEQSLEDRTERFMTFTSDQVTGPGRKQPKPGKFSLDSAASPKQIDLHFPSGPNSFIHIRGIYRMEGDRLTIFQASDWTASKRPTSFEPKPGDKRSLLVFERVRVPDRELLQGAWTATALEGGGQTAPKSTFHGKQMVFDGDRVSRFDRANQFREFRLNSTTNPKQIDIGASVEGQFTKCIYELNGDTLRICLAQKPSHRRPENFDTEGTRHLSVTFHRAELTEQDKQADPRTSSPVKPLIPKTPQRKTGILTNPPKVPPGGLPVGRNLIIDPSLENAAIGRLPETWSAWLDDGPEFKCEVVEGGVTGKHCLKISGKGTRGVVFATSIPMDRTKRYALKGRVKVVGDADTWAVIKLNYFNKTGWLGVDDRVGVTPKHSGWQLFEKTDRADAFSEATLMVPTCHIEGNGTAWFDDLELVAYDRNKLPADFDAKHGKNNRLSQNQNPKTLSND